MRHKRNFTRWWFHFRRLLLPFSDWRFRRTRLRSSSNNSCRCKNNNIDLFFPAWWSQSEKSYSLITVLNHHFEIFGLDKSVSISSSSSLAPTAWRSPAAMLSNRMPLSSLCLSDRHLQPPRFCSALTKHWSTCCLGFLQAWMFIIKRSVCVLTLAAVLHM